jgi:mono/diheme cytochrome c family protein
LTAAALLLAVGVSAEEPDVKAIGQGRGLYLQYCASCHGSDGKGGGPAGADLKTALPDLTRMPTKGGRFDETHAVVSIDGTRAVRAHQKGEMPIWGNVLAKSGPRRGESGAATQIHAVVKYLASIQVTQTALQK